MELTKAAGLSEDESHGPDNVPTASRSNDRLHRSSVMPDNPFELDTCSKRESHISEMRSVTVCDIGNQLSLGRIAPTTSFVRRHNPIFCAATPKRAPLVAMFQITMKEPFNRARPDGVSFLT
jgi:hypothetical protein